MNPTPLVQQKYVPTLPVILNVHYRHFDYVVGTAIPVTLLFSLMLGGAYLGQQESVVEFVAEAYGETSRFLKVKGQAVLESAERTAEKAYDLVMDSAGGEEKLARRMDEYIRGIHLDYSETVWSEVGGVDNFVH